MITVLCYLCETEVLMENYDVFDTVDGVYHKKWKGVCKFSHPNEYIDFTRSYLSSDDYELSEEDELLRMKIMKYV